MKRFVWLLVVAACGTSISAVRTNRPIRAMVSRDPMAVEMFTSGNPQRPYVEVAYIEAQQESDVSLDAAPDVMNKMRESAGQLGCDALIVGGPNDAVVGSTFGGTGHSKTLRGYRGTCIQWADDPVSAAAPPQQ
jgi:hypothetical protein